MSSNTSNPEKSVPGTASAKPANPYAPIVRKTGNFLIKRPAHPAFPWPTRKFAKVRIWPKFCNSLFPLPKHRTRIARISKIWFLIHYIIQPLKPT